MRLKQVPLLVLSASIVGCATTEKSVPETYSGPIATVTDSGQVQSTRLVHIFEMTKVDGRALEGSRVATLRRNYGRGMNQTPVILSNPVPAGELRVSLAAATVYAAPILEFTNPTCRVKGETRFTAEPNGQYRVTGSLTSQQCAVWIEDIETNAVVSEKIVGTGSK
jgi:hypothetical protein